MRMSRLLSLHDRLANCAALAGQSRSRLNGAGGVATSHDWYWMSTWPTTQRSTPAASTDPEGFWGEQAGLVDWIRKPQRGPRRRAGRRSTAGSPTPRSTPATTRSTGTSSPAAPTRPRWSTTARSPAPSATLHLRRAARRTSRRSPACCAALGRREGRPGRHLHADGPGGRHRDAGLRPARRGALGGLRRLRGRRARRPHRRRPAQGRRRRLVRHRARRGSSSTSRCSTGRSSSPSTSPAPCVILQRPQVDGGRWSRAGTSTGTSPCAPGAPTRRACVEVAATDPLYVLYTSGTTGQAQGHRARQRRPRGRDGLVDAATSTTSTPGRSGGPPPTSAGWSATPTSSTRR